MTLNKNKKEEDLTPSFFDYLLFGFLGMSTGSIMITFSLVSKYAENSMEFFTFVLNSVLDACFVILMFSLIGGLFSYFIKKEIKVGEIVWKSFVIHNSMLGIMLLYVFLTSAFNIAGLCIIAIPIIITVITASIWLKN